MDHTPIQPLRSRLPERQRVPGLPIPLIERLKMVPRWAWLIAIGFALPLVLIPAVALARYTTTSSTYCLSCHAKGDTPDRGVKSVVHPSFDQVGCVDCHAKPGQVVF
ncbi:MAG TPA: NapC/NirT family cytochrome c, partial [Thermoleophilia bacterium]|nr:NapC/NirT family cytochrome c [Thermoleophilia bacterium]